MIWLEIAAGLVLLFGGGEALVRGSVGAAARLGVSPLLIGLTLVGFGTSVPELVASLEAALIGAPDIAIGNVVGSNIANMLLIVGASAAILPMVTTKRAFRRDGTMLVAATLLFVAVVLYGTLTRWLGGGFILLLAAYIVYSYLTERRGANGGTAVHVAQANEVTSFASTIWANGLLALIGIVAIGFGANLLVKGAVEVARDFGYSEAVIGLTLVAVGTSLPELATSVVAALRRHGDVAFGNIVGSNLFNILGIAGATAILSPITVPPEIMTLDIWVMLAATGLLILFAMTGWRVNRTEAAIFLAAYGVYVAVQLVPHIRSTIGLS